MRHHPRPTTREGFTLVELLVSMALIIVIMTVLSVAFATGLNTFGQLKAIGDMSEQLRSATTVIRTDLAADHLQNEADDRVRLYEVPTSGAWNGSRKGFFYIRHDSAGVPEGVDADNIASWRSGGSPLPSSPGMGSHEFGMTIRLSARTQSDTCACSAHPLIRGYLASSNLVDHSIVDSTGNPVQQVSQWAEVYYFLRQTSVV